MVPPNFLPDLRTAGLHLRGPETCDIPGWYQRATDREAAALAGDRVPESISEGAIWLAGSMERTRAGGRLQWVIDCPDVAENVGTVSLSLRTAEISFVIGRAFWGRGIATQAVRRVLAYGFDELGLNVVRAELVEGNIASQRLLTGCGFRITRRFVDESDGAHCLKMQLLETERLF